MATERRTKLTGATTEFLVAAQLCRMGLMATPFAGTVPHYDIIASGRHGGHCANQVKAINSNTWQFNMKSFMDVSLEGPRQIVGNVKLEPFPELTSYWLRSRITSGSKTVFCTDLG